MRAIALRLVRLAVAGAICGVIGVLAIYGGWRFLNPYAEEWQARRELTALDHRVQKLRAEHQRLRKQARLLHTPEGVKAEARRLGLVKPGERSLRFMTRPEPRAQAPKPEPAPSGVFERLRAWGRAVLALPGKAEAADTQAQPKSDD